MNLPSKEHPMNAHQRYVAAALNQLDAKKLAAMIACPPGNRSSAKSAADIHGWVKDYSGTETSLLTKWADLLAQAAAEKPGDKDEWPVTWWASISDLLFDPEFIELLRSEAEGQAEVTELHQAAA